MTKDILTQSIETVDLPALVAELWPESGARPGRAGVCRAVWRGDTHPSLSLFQARGMWFWKDHGSGESGNAFHLLLKAGMSKDAAAELLKNRAGSGETVAHEASIKHRASLRPVRGLTPAEKRALEAAQQRLDEAAIRGRGITLEQARRVGLGKSRQGDLVIPILGPTGEVQAIKARLREPREGFRYRYLTPERGAPAWYSPGFGQNRGRPVIVMEGELNAITSWFALEGRADLLGIPGVEGRVPWERLEGRRVYLYADGDPGGRRAIGRWKEEGEAVKVAMFVLEPLEGGLDACEYAARWGQQGLAGQLWRLMEE
ncbi:toprim domain-containing protein [Meiothermus ruber]|uniref:toprim domain-containing protein n=1 Tax=Meiothermus ruber TaxID=277 RepID=UPI0003D64881|nr:toprim domain-containing protein [Meiothermus ruber]GAO74202.1 phage/plasmid primase, P4 family [Meiothermus ruber H328]